MNGIYFLLPFILVAGLGIYQNSFAEQTIIGEAFFDTTNPDGSHTWSSHSPYIFDGNNWVPFIQNGNEKETAHGNVLLNADGSFTWTDKGFTDKIVAKYADISNLNSWTYPATLNNDTPDISWDGTAFTSSKMKAGVGQLDYKYILTNGKWKTQLEATNLSSLTTKVFGFDQIIDINSDTIKFGGVTRNLDNFNGITFNKNFLDANKAKVLDLLNGVHFDFDIAYDNLYSVTIHDTGINKSQLVFDYRTNTILLPNNTLVIDPSYSVNTNNYFIDSGNNALCDGNAITVGGSTTLLASGWEPTASANDCYVADIEFDVSSIPVYATITDTDLYIKTATSSNPTTLDTIITSINFDDLSTRTDAQRFASIIGGSTYISTTTEFDTNNNIVTVDLGTTADSNLQTDLSSGSFAVGLRPTGAQDTTSKYHQFQSATGTVSPQLIVTYTAGSPANPITLITAANLGPNSVDLIWSLPTDNGTGTFQTFVVNSTTPWGEPLTFNQNSTALYANVTGLTFGTDYSFRVAMATEFAYNTTGSYILNVTTSTNTYSTPPSTLTVNDCNHTCSTQLNLEWLAGSMQNVNGYRIARESPIGGGFSTLVSNTTNTNTYYNNTGLTSGTFYNYKVYSLNASGISTASNTFSRTPHHLPDAVTDLSAQATDLLSVLLSWTAPTLYGTLDGYMINYTTPYGDPTTILTSSTGSSDVTYEITGLSSSDGYSFRVSPVTYHGTNVTGANIANATAFQNFDIGSVTLPTGDNTASLDIAIKAYDHNSTATDVQVVYDSSMDLACDFSYKYAHTNNTYTGLTQNAISGTDVYSNFTLQNPNNEVIDVHCWDVNDPNTEGRYRLTQTVYSDIPILNQILGFQSGDFGTLGMFGAIDMITLLVVIVSMIGFNRVNPAVGVIFTVVILGILAWYEVIQVPTVMIGVFVLLVTLAITQVKKP